MREIPLHFVPILVAAAARIVLGALWYSPALLVKPWMRLAGITEAQVKEGFPRAVIVDIIGSLLMAFALAHAIRWAEASTVLPGMAIGFLNWLGFIAVATITNVTYERRPFNLFLITNGYQLVSLLLMGAILAVWG